MSQISLTDHLGKPSQNIIPWVHHRETDFQFLEYIMDTLLAPLSQGPVLQNSSESMTNSWAQDISRGADMDKRDSPWKNMFPNSDVGYGKKTGPDRAVYNEAAPLENGS